MKRIVTLMLIFYTLISQGSIQAVYAQKGTNNNKNNKLDIPPPITFLFHGFTQATVLERLFIGETIVASHKSGLFFLQVSDVFTDQREKMDASVSNLYLGGPIFYYGRDYPLGWVVRLERVTGLHPIYAIAPQLNLENTKTALGDFLLKKKIELFFQFYTKDSNKVGKWEIFNRFAFHFTKDVNMRGFTHYFMFKGKPNIFSAGEDVFVNINKNLQVYWRVNYSSRDFFPITFGGFDSGVGLRLVYKNF